jgi:hypothetical protein
MTKVKALLARAARRPRKAGRSRLYQWMAKNHAELAAAFENAPPDWTVLAEEFGKAGLTDRTGKPARPSTAKQTWFRVGRDLRKIESTRPRPRQKPEEPQVETAPASHPPSPQVVARPSPLPLVEEQYDEPDVRPKFEFARPIGKAARKP